MAFNSSGQISYLVLDSLADGSKYGLEIIEFISKKTGGNYIMKKPTLYSCLTRMEKKGLVSSSYWGESELGGKRHYYTITNDGKRELDELKKEFDTPQNTEGSVQAAPAMTENIEITTAQEDKPIFLQQDNLFDIAKKPAKKEEKKAEESDIIENQIDIFSFQETLQNTTQEQSQEGVEPNESEEKMKYYQQILEQSPVKTQDDGKLLEENEKLTEIQEAQNKVLYDTSSELKKYRKRKSFSENQIEMAMTYESVEEKDIQRERIEQLKQAMLNSRQNVVDLQKEEQKNEPIVEKADITIQTHSQTIIEPQEQKDDAVYITHRIDASEMPIQKKISPTNIEVNIYDDNLPAPKRDSNLEPTYKDMMAKLFERKKEKPVVTPVEVVEEKEQVQSFTDYNSLKKYYGSHGIEFKEYRKTTVARHHNTNFLNFISASILLLLAGVGSSILFGIIAATQHLRTETNFMFYTLPILFLIYVVYSLIKHKAVQSKTANLVYNAPINWAIAILSTIIIFVVNVFCGMQFETIGLFATSLFVPILGVLLAFPINHHLKKFLYKKYAK